MESPRPQPAASSDEASAVPSEEAEQPLDLWRLGRGVVSGLLLLALLSWLVTAVWGDELEAFGRWFVSSYGAVGVGVAVLALDTSPIPLVSEPVFLVALSGGLEPGAIGVAASLGSLGASACGYLLGWSVGRPLMKRFLAEEVRDRARRLISRHGFWGIALAALTPLPFALCTWTAGALRMRLLPFALGCLFRVPRVAFYLWLTFEAWRAAR
jgi:membrane protein YqaA with SNARE-associated domain